MRLLRLVTCAYGARSTAARNQLENLLQSFNRTLCKSVCEVCFLSAAPAPAPFEKQAADKSS